MTDETNTPENPQADGPKPFDQERWLILVGIRQRQDEDPASAHPFPHNLTIGMAVTPEAVVPTSQGNRPDKTIPSVHFAHWLDRNWGALTRLWEVEYAQYSNLSRRTQPVGRPPELSLVDTSGQRLSTDIQQ